MAEPLLRVAMVGCGAISAQYLATFERTTALRLVAFADLVPDRAEELAARWGQGAVALHPSEIPLREDVDLVLNLTVPVAHAATTLAGLRGGKHVYSEKPLATTTAEAREIVELSQQTGLRAGCAPDTVLGTGIQTARAVVDAGDIGTPVAATAFLMGTGPDNSHPNPAFFYQPGAGPLFDMGPYYVTALVTLLGPVSRVVAMGRASTAQRRVSRGPNAGMLIEVGVETHVSATLEHRSGVLSTLVTSFDIPAGSVLPRIEVYGDAGTLGAPDPNHFDGEVTLRRDRGSPWQGVEPRAGYRSAGRGVGVADLALALRSGEPPRASAELGYHVLEVLESVQRAASTGSAVTLTSTVERASPVPLGNVAPGESASTAAMASAAATEAPSGRSS